MANPLIWIENVVPDEVVLPDDDAAPSAAVGEDEIIEAVVALTPVAVVGAAPFDVSDSRCCTAHAPTRLVKEAESANAAGVEPQFVYCCM